MGQFPNDIYLNAQMLLAMPSMGDTRFERSVIYICAHSKDGAMGIVVNKSADEITFPELLEQLHIIPEENRINVRPARQDIHVHFGGPVETGRGFVLHSSDYFSDDATLPIDENTGLTATLDVLRAIAKGNGPRQALLALGYAGWGPGQLEQEILSNGWLHCDADEQLLFGTDLGSKYAAAMTKIGIMPGQLTSQSGRA
jgi:putative transcriptional regulator